MASPTSGARALRRVISCPSMDRHVGEGSDAKPTHERFRTQRVPVGKGSIFPIPRTRGKEATPRSYAAACGGSLLRHPNNPFAQASSFAPARVVAGSAPGKLVLGRAEAMRDGSSRRAFGESFSLLSGAAASRPVGG